jgi:hypothetical protein
MSEKILDSGTTRDSQDNSWPHDDENINIEELGFSVIEPDDTVSSAHDLGDDQNDTEDTLLEIEYMLESGNTSDNNDDGMGYMYVSEMVNRGGFPNIDNVDLASCIIRTGHGEIVFENLHKLLSDDNRTRFAKMLIDKGRAYIVMFNIDEFRSVVDPFEIAKRMIKDGDKEFLEEDIQSGIWAPTPEQLKELGL